MILDLDDPKQPLTPGATYYVLPVNVGANETMYRVSYGLVRAPHDAGPPAADLPRPDLARPDQSPPVRLDGGAGPGPEPTTPTTERGCSCELGSTGASPAPILLVLPAAFLLAARRRRRSS